MVLLLVSNVARISGFHINNFQFTVFYSFDDSCIYAIGRKTCGGISDY